MDDSNGVGAIVCWMKESIVVCVLIRINLDILNNARHSFSPCLTIEHYPHPAVVTVVQRSVLTKYCLEQKRVPADCACARVKEQVLRQYGLGPARPAPVLVRSHYLLLFFWWLLLFSGASLPLSKMFSSSTISSSSSFSHASYVASSSSLNLARSASGVVVGIACSCN